MSSDSTLALGPRPHFAPSDDAGEPGAPPARGTPSPAPRAAATLPATVAVSLRERIVQGQFPPGARLNERYLCELLGVSRTPLREAFRLLAAEGLIELEPKRGAQVVAMSETRIREAFEVIGGLEAMSSRFACERATDAEIAEIRALTFEMQASHARRDLPTYYRLNHAIHECLSKAAHNTLLNQLYDTQNARIQHLRFASNEDPAKWDQAMREHVEMADALGARDGERLAGILRGHLQRKCDAALRALASHGVAAPESG
ncbi:GntR family transcriptional regulator [Bordetella genomosp. 5]|uniref:GntR family transcriptional regulator n=1 Tax=Bordetella genomosp. 5 TaxID=1395608 RepID=UPI000B9E9CD1|nr:GntR family transcriptional regulator [Bordetella genomosp. 5]OZI41181.1 GntR family transcriptional regulator [Bordetella genomosp. 5]